MTEKKVWELQVDEELRTLIPPLTDDERRLLEENILANGCDTPIVVWNGMIVDGHNRYEVCRKHNIPFATEEKEYASKSDVEMWMLRNQLGRRNLNDYQRGEMVLKLEAAVAEKTRQTDKPGQDETTGDVAKWPPASNGEKTREALGRLAGVSGRTLQRVKKIVNKADEQTKQELREGKLSISKAYSDVMEKERKTQKGPAAENKVNANAMAGNEETLQVEEQEYPVQGMAMYKGHPIHIGSVPEDRPEMFTHVQGLLDFAVHGYLADVREAMKWFGPNMRTPENVRRVEEMLRTTCESALALLHENDQDNDESEKED